MVTPLSKAKQKQDIKNAHGIINPLHKRLYTLKEAAEYLGRSEWSMRELIWARKIPVVREDGGRKIYLDVSDLDRFIEQNKVTYS